MTDAVTAHPEYARVFLHYSQHGSSPEDAARLAYEHTQKYLAAAPAASARKPTSTRKTLLIVGAVILAGIAAIGLAAVIVRSGDGTGDVAITNCDSGSDTFRVEVKVTNSTSSTKSYRIKVEVVDYSDNRTGDANGYVADLAAGQSATQVVTGSKTAGGTRCKLVDVSRS